MRTNRSITAGLATVAALAAVLLAGCADDPGDDAPTPTPPAEVPDPTASSGPTLPISPPGLQPPPTHRTGELTLTGDVISGVEPNCTLLETDTGLYLLFGGALDELRVGTTATVRGEVQANMASTCQQGTPFEVFEVID
jgi:hypothetical protein